MLLMVLLASTLPVLSSRSAAACQMGQCSESSPDDSLLVSATCYNIVQLWDVETDLQVQVPKAMRSNRRSIPSE